MLTKGIGTDKNPEKVLFWLNKAAEQNFPEAQYNLANAYRDGVVVQKNEEKALELYLKAAEQNLPEAQSNAAYIYANTYNDLEKEKI
ncbi:sel1 repeat family protein [Acinetobacter johnsonii]|nr:sel1 repeat family protein [Acinetobacter johnsonii]